MAFADEFKSDREVTRFIEKIVNYLWYKYNRKPDYVELLSTGGKGFAEALNNYDPDRGVSFKSYAWNYVGWIVKSKCNRFLEKKSEQSDRHFSYDEANYTDNSFLGLLGDERLHNSVSPEQLYMELEEERISNQFTYNRIHSLSKRDQYIIIERFWGNKTLQEIGDDLNLSKERIRQLEMRALHQIRTMEDDMSKYMSKITIDKTIEEIRKGGSLEEIASRLGISVKVLSWRMSVDDEIGYEAFINHLSHPKGKKRELFEERWKKDMAPDKVAPVDPTVKEDLLVDQAPQEILQQEKKEILMDQGIIDSEQKQEEVPHIPTDKVQIQVNQEDESEHISQTPEVDVAIELNIDHDSLDQFKATLRGLQKVLIPHFGFTGMIVLFGIQFFIDIAITFRLPIILQWKVERKD